MDAARWPGQKSPDIRSLMVWGVVPDDMDDALVGVACLDLGEQLYGADPIDGDRLDKGRVEGLQVHRAVNIHAASA